MPADIQAILGNGIIQPTNPLVTMQNWQNLTNSAVQQAEGMQNIKNQQTQNQIGQQSLIESRNNFLGGMIYAQHLTGGDAAAGYDNVFNTALKLGADPHLVASIKDKFDSAPDDATRAQLGNAAGLRMVNPQIAQAMTGTAGNVTAGVRSYPAVVPGVGFPNQGQPQFGAAGAPPNAGGGGYFTPSATDRVTGPPNPNTGESTSVPLGSVTPPAMGGVGASPPSGNVPPGGYSHANPPPIAGVPGQPTAPQQTAAIPGQMTTGLPPQFETSRQMGNTLVAGAQNVTQNKADYNNLLSELQNISTGPGTQTQERTAAFLQKWGKSPFLSGLDTSKLADTESFNKISQTIANRQAGLLSGSNQSQASAISATPNLSLSTPGNTQIIHKLQGNEDAIGAKADAWNAWTQKNGQGSFNQFSTWWNKTVDVRSFQQKYMEKPETEALKDSLIKSNSIRNFNDSTALVRRAQSDPNGWLAVVPQSTR